MPAGTYTLKVSDPSSHVLTVAPADRQVVVDGDAVLAASTLQRDEAAAGFLPCADAQDVSCVEALTVTLPGDTTAGPCPRRR